MAVGAPLYVPMAASAGYMNRHTTHQEKGQPPFSYLVHPLFLRCKDVSASKMSPASHTAKLQARACLLASCVSVCCRPMRRLSLPDTSKLQPASSCTERRVGGPKGEEIGRKTRMGQYAVTEKIIDAYASSFVTTKSTGTGISWRRRDVTLSCRAVESANEV